MQRLSTFCGHFQKLYITARTLLGTVVEFDTSYACLSRKLFRVYDPVTRLEYRVEKLVCTCSADHERDWPRVIKVVFFGLATNALNVRNNNTTLSTKRGWARFSPEIYPRGAGFHRDRHVG